METSLTVAISLNELSPARKVHRSPKNKSPMSIVGRGYYIVIFVGKNFYERTSFVNSETSIKPLPHKSKAHPCTCCATMNECKLKWAIHRHGRIHLKLVPCINSRVLKYYVVLWFRWHWTIEWHKTSTGSSTTGCDGQGFHCEAMENGRIWWGMQGVVTLAAGNSELWSQSW